MELAMRDWVIHLKSGFSIVIMAARHSEMLHCWEWLNFYDDLPEANIIAKFRMDDVSGVFLDASCK